MTTEERAEALDKLVTRCVEFASRKVEFGDFEAAKLVLGTATAAAELLLLVESGQS